MSGKKYKRKIAVFASGFGSNFEAIVKSEASGKLEAEIALLVTDKPGCYAAKRAVDHGIEVFSFNPKEYASKEDFEKETARILEERKIDLIVLAGYMRIVGKILLERFDRRIINIHPSLLPAFPGLNAIAQAYEYGAKIVGVTIHYVDEGIDTGRIIEQDCFHIQGHETLEEIEERIHEIEHRLLPETIQKIIMNLR